MMNSLTPEDIRAMAAQVGLDKLSETHLRQLLRVTQEKRAQPAALPVAGLTPADEPANVFVVVSTVPHRDTPP